MTWGGGLNTALRGDENSKPANSEGDGEWEKLENDCMQVLYVL